MNLLIKQTIRKLTGRKFNLIINLTGLTLGMTALLFIWSWMNSEKSYDKNWDHADQIYRVALTRSFEGKVTQTTAQNFKGVAQVLCDKIPEIEAATNIDKDIITVFTPEASVQNINMFFADTAFFKVFPVSLESEHPDRLLSTIHDAIMSRSLAQKLFGNTNPLGQSFKLNEGWEFNVVALYDDLPENSHIRFDLILHQRALRYYMRNFNYATGELDLTNLAGYTDPDPYAQGQWRSTRTYTYIRLKPGSSISQVESKYRSAIEPCISHLTANHEAVSFEFQPVTGIHLYSARDNELSANGSHTKVLAFEIIALLLILISFLNYINIALANNLNEAPIHTLHRILGANRFRLFSGFITEAFIMNALAGLLALLPGILFLLKGTSIAGFHIFPVGLGTMILLVALMVITGTLLTALYPYLYALYKLRTTRKAQSTGSPTINTSMRSLVVFQFAASIFLIIGTFFIFRQLHYMQQSETGMNMEHTLASFSPMTMIKKPDEVERLRTFRQEVRKIPGVTAFTTAEIMAGKPFDRSSNEVRLFDQESDQTTYALASIDYDYFDFFGIRLIEGQLFNSSTPYDGEEVILNEKACSTLGLTPSKAQGNLIQIGNRSFRVKGIIADYHHLSLKDEIAPVIYFNSLRWFRTVGHYYIKIAPGNQPQTIKAVNTLWNRIYPQEEYHYVFLDDKFNLAYQADIHFGRVFLILSMLTIFIACMGLLALTRFLSAAKTKEIGIRKVNGATVTEILTLLNKSFIKWIGLAFILASPIAWFVLHNWLEGFAYKTTLSWWVFAATGLLTITLTVLTVSWQSWRTATKNPVEALRYE